MTYTHAHARTCAPHDQEPGPAAVPIRSLALLAYVAAGVGAWQTYGRSHYGRATVRPGPGLLPLTFVYFFLYSIEGIPLCTPAPNHMSKLPKQPKTLKVRQPVKPRLAPTKLAADLLKFAQWADCDETGKLETEFLELSRDASTGSQCHFLEALLFLRLASVSLYHAKHQAQFATQWSRSRTVSPEDVEAWLANSSLKLAQKCLRDVAGIEQAIVDEIPE